MIYLVLALGVAYVAIVVLGVLLERRPTNPRPPKPATHQHEWSQWNDVTINVWYEGVVKAKNTKQQRRCSTCGFRESKSYL